MFSVSKVVQEAAQNVHILGCCFRPSFVPSMIQWHCLGTLKLLLEYFYSTFCWQNDQRHKDKTNTKVIQNSVKYPLHPVPPPTIRPVCSKPQPTGLEHFQGWSNTKRWINGCLILILKETRKIFILFCVITFW